MNCALWPWTLWGLSADTRPLPEQQSPTFSFRPQGRTPGRDGSPHDGNARRLPPPEGFQNATAEVPLAAPPAGAVNHVLPLPYLSPLHAELGQLANV